MTTVDAGGVTSWRNRAQVRVSMQTPEFLGNAQRKGLGHRTSLLQAPVQRETSLIRGNKGGRVCRSSKIA